MRLVLGLVFSAWAAMPKVLESLDNLAMSLRDETESTHFADYEAGCTEEQARSQAAAGQLAERLEVLKAESGETTTRVEELDQAILAKKLEIETVEAEIAEEEKAREASRAAYDAEDKALGVSKAELGDALAKHEESQWTEKSSLSQLRKLSRSLLSTSEQDKEVRPLMFLQLGQPHELEVAEDKLRKEQKELRDGFEAKKGEHNKRIDELKATRTPLELDMAKLVPAKANAEARSAGSGARVTDIERTQGKLTASADSQKAVCKHVLDELQAEDEQRALVEHKLAGAIESLSSSVFSSLVEKSAKALDMSEAEKAELQAKPPASLLEAGSETEKEESETSDSLDTSDLEAPSFVQLRSRLGESTSLAVRVGAEADPFLDVKNRIRALMDSLRDSNNKDVDSVTWCAQEAESTERNSEKKKNEADMAAALIREHTDMEAEYAEEKSEVTNQQHAFGVAFKQAMQNFADHKQRGKERRKAHLLAGEVLTDASRLVREFYGVASQEGAFLQQTPSEAGQKEAAERAIALLDEAKTGVTAMASEAEKQEGPGDLLVETAQSAGDALQLARKQELNSLEVVTSALEDTRLEAELNKQNAEAALVSIDATKEQVKMDCMSPDDGVDSAKRREDQIAAMQDALKVLEGEDIPIATPALMQGRPFGASRNSRQPVLSPLDRAAAAMGIRVRPQ